MTTKAIYTQLLLISVTLLTSSFANSQDTFYKAYGNTQTYSFKANAICNVSGTGNGYLLAGQRYTPTTGSSDVCIMHINDSGAVQWSKTYGGSNDDVAWDIRPAQNGNYIVAGSTKSVSGVFDMYILLIDGAGNVVASKTSGGPNLDIAFCASPTSDGGFIIAARTQSYGAGNEEFYLLKLNSTLNVQWSRTVGNTNPDYASWAEETPDHGIIASGYTTLNGWDFLLVKTDSIGNVIWQKNYGTPIDNEYAYVVKPTPDGGYITAGDQTSGGGGVRKGIITKVNAAGTVEWSKSFSSAGFVKLNTMYIDTTGYVFGGYIVHNSQTKALVIKTDFNGDTLFVNALGSSISFDYCERIMPATQGGMIICGQSSYIGNYGNDFLLVKADSNANARCYNNTVAITVANLTLNSASFGSNSAGASIANYTSQGLAAPVTDTVFCSTILSSLPEFPNDNFFSVYPNPVSGELHISFKENNISNARYIIYNLRGEVVVNGILSPKQNILINELSDGVFYLKIITADFSVVKRVIKVRE